MSLKMSEDEEDESMDQKMGVAVGGGWQDGDDDTSSSPAAVKVKPALKKVSNRVAKPKKGLQWDEKAIEEHDLLRGTRMKIDEPNTPFTQYDSGQESDDSRRPKSPVEPKQEALSWDTLQNRLDTVAAVRAAYPSSPSSSHGGDHSEQSDVEDERRKEMRAVEFREHRKRHYNEMELVRKFRAEHPEGAMVNESDDNDADDERQDE